MKKTGGLAWPSTVEYYRLICAGANAHFRSLGHPMPLPSPPIMIESLNMAETGKLRGKPDGTGWQRFDAAFRAAFRRLQAVGCDFGLIAGNTPHARLDAILLACTELPLAFPAHCGDAAFEVEGLRFVNTTVVHARAALAEALGVRRDRAWGRGRPTCRWIGACHAPSARSNSDTHKSWYVRG